MKVNLRSSYAWEFVVVEPTEAKGYREEFNVDLPQKEVLDMLRIQVEVEELQQRLKPLFEAAKEREKAATEAAKEKAELERIEAEGAELHPADDVLAALWKGNNDQQDNV